MSTGTEQRMESALTKVTNMSFQNFFPGIFKSLFCILTSELVLVSSTVLCLLKEDKQFQQWLQIVATASYIININANLGSVLFLILY